MNTISFIDVIIAIAVAALGTAGSYAISALASYFKSKKAEIDSYIETNSTIENNQAIKDALHTVNDIASNVVNALNTTYKQELINATSDGKLTKEDGKLLRDKAIELISAEVADPVKDLLTGVIGDFSEYAKTLVENCVAAAKGKVANTKKSTTNSKQTTTKKSDNTSFSKKVD